MKPFYFKIPFAKMNSTIYKYFSILVMMIIASSLIGSPSELCNQKSVTIVNNGSCPVDIYWWKTGGDEYYTTIEPCDSWSIHASDKQMWRATSSPTDWHNLQYDESYTTNADCIQTWTIVPTYCGGTTCNDPGVDYLYECNASVSVDVYGSGCDGGASAVLVPNSANVFQTIMEIVYKGCDPGSTVHANVDGNNITFSKIALSGGSSSVYVYRALVGGPVSSASHDAVCGSCVSNSGLQSIIAYAFRNLSIESAAGGTFTSISGYNDVQDFNIPLFTDTEARNVTVEVPISELTTDERHMRITASAGGQSANTTINGPNSGCCLNIVSITIPNVPGSATSVNVEVNTTTSTDNQFPQNAGQSYVIAGLVNATAECVGCQAGIVCPPDVTIDCDQSSDPSFTGMATANSNCGNSTITYMDDLSGTCPQTLTRTWTATISTQGTNNCVPDLLAKWYFDNIEAGCLNGIGPLDAGVTVTHLNNGNCSNFSVSKVTGAANGSSCVQGSGGSSEAAICIQDQDDATWSDNDDDAAKFDISFGSNDEGTFTTFCLKERATHSNENFGDNEPPTRFGVRVLKDGVEIFQQIDIPTTAHWSTNCFDINDTYSGATTYTVEVLGYAATGPNTRHAWELDDFEVYGCCGTAAPPTNETYTCVQTITIVDNELPTLTGVPADVTIACIDDVPDVPTDVVADDNCGFDTDYSESITGTQPCDYVITRTWTVTDLCNNEVSQSQVITISSDIVATAGGEVEICDGSAFALTGEGAGGCGQLEYSWSGPGGYSSDQQNPTDATASGTYTLTVSDAQGCSATDAHVVDVKDPPLSGISAQPQVCAGEEAQFAAVPAVAGATYAWTFAGPATPATATESVVNVTWADVPGDYDVTLEVNLDGCIATYETIITVTMEVVAAAGPDATICQGGTIDLDGSGSAGNGFLWTVVSGDPTAIDLGGSADIVTVSPLVTTTFELKVDDVANGCTSVDQVTVSVDVDFNPIADAGGPELTICQNGVVQLDGTGSLPPPADPGAILSYAWTPIANMDDPTSPTPQVTVGANTTYQLIVSTQSGCSDTAFVDIIVAGCDLSLEKIVNDESPNVGDEVTFTLTVTNEGTLPVSGIDVEDYIPAGFSSVNSISDGGSLVANTISWSNITLNAAASVDLTFNATVNAPAGNPLDYCNTAQITASDEFDIDSTPNNDDGDQSEDDEAKAVLIPQQADVSILKEVNDASPNVGDVVTFTITVSNDGPNAATGVTVADNLPNGYSNIENISSGGGQTGGLIVWAGLSIPVGGSESVSFDATVEAPLAGVDYLNIAEVTAMDQFDVDSEPNNDDGDQSEDDEDNAEVVPQLADVSLLKEVSDASPNVGDVVTFTITVSNDGPNAATNVSVADNVPNGYSAISNVGQGGSTSGSTVSWSGIDIPVGGSESLTFDATVEAPLAGVDYLNIAEVTAMDQFDVDSEPNNDDGDQSEDDEDNAEVVPQVADVSLLKEVSDASPNVGDIVTFTIIVSNDGPNAATGVTVADNLPNGYSNIANISSGGGQTGGLIVWAGLSIPVGGSESVTFDATVEAPLAGVDYLNIAEVTAMDQFDVDSEPNNDDGDQSEDDEDNAEVVPQLADVSLLKEVSDASPNVGDVVTFTITVSNDGPNAATNVSVADNVPNGYSAISNVGQGGSTSGSTVSWSGIDIPVGGSESLTFDATVEAPLAGVVYLNIAEVTAMDQFDVDSEPNNDDGDQSEDDEDNAEVVPQVADVSLLKEVSDASPNVGDVVTFTITVSNDGPNAATGVTVADNLPNGYSNIANISSGGGQTGGLIVWAGLSIPVGGSESVSFDATVEAPLAGVDYLNIAEVTAMDQFDVDSEPNNDDGDQSEDDEDNAEVVPQLADVSLLKEVSDASPNVGDVVTFTITVSNDGPNAATNVSVADNVPNGYSAISNVGQGGNASGSTVSWSGIDIPVGGSESLTFDATVEAPLAGVDYLNIAEVTAMDQFDVDSEPNNDDGDQSEDDEDSVEVAPQVADVSLLKEVSDASPNVGDVVTFTITVSNDGPNAATGVTVADNLPNGYSNIENISSGGGQTGGLIVWAGLSIPVGGSESVSFDATVEAPLAGVDYLNIAEVTAMDQFDVDSEPNNDDGDQSEDDEDNAEVVPQLADVSLLKEVSDASPNVGDVVTFTITVSNDGPNAATNVSVADNVPNGYSAISNVGQGGSTSGSTVSWSGIDIPVGGSESLTFDATVEAPLAGVDYLNIAEVTAMDQFDVDSEPNNDDGDQSEDDEDNAEVVPQVADVSLLKEVSDASPNVGDIVTFTIIVSNDGPNAATGVTVADNLPNGYSNIANISSGGGQTGGLIVWAGLSIPVGGSESVSFDATVEAPLAGVDYLNIAEVTAMDQFDVDSEPNNDDGDQSEDDEDNAEVVPQLADVSLLKEVSDASPNVGDVVTFTITVSNDGPNAATNVSVADNVPNGYSAISNVGQGGSASGSAVSWSGIDIPVGGSESLTFDATVEAPLAGVDYLNIAEVTAMDQFDVDSEPNNDDGDQSEDDEDSVEVAPQLADLSLLKEISNDRPNIGEVVTFTITVTNEGPSDATGVTVADLVPNGYDNISNISSGGGATGDLVVWAGLSIPNGGAVSLTFDATVLLPGDNVSFLNVAEITAADQFDIDSTPNNDDGDQSEDDEDNADALPQLIDLSLIKSVSNSTPNIGEQITFTIDVSNQGPDDATGVSVADIVPSGYTDISNISNGGAASGNNITWNGLSIASGSTFTLSFSVTVGSPIGSYINIAEITAADQYDIDSTPDNGADTDGDGLIGSEDPDGSQDPDDEDDGDDATIVPNGSISGTVTADVDNDDSGDEPLSGVTIQLKDLAGNVVAETTTDANGFYEFTGIAPGDYKLMEMDPAGYQDVSDEDTTPDPDGADGTVDDMIPVTLDAGESDDDNDFVEEQLASISGTVTADIDNDDSGDEPLSGVTIQLKDLAGNVVAETTTDANGFYEFTGLAPGDYKLMEIDPAGYQDVSDEDTTPDPDGADGTVDDMIPVTLDAGEADDDNDFVEEQLASISGTVTADINNDDSGDEPLSGVTIQLKDLAGNVVAETTTDANGFYEFLGVQPGEYKLMEMDPAGYEDVSDEDTTPDPDGADGIVDDMIPVTLDAGEADDNNDFVEEELASISGTVTEDVDNDDTGDDPISGVQIVLKDGAGNTLATTNTDGNGFFEFLGLLPGDYILMEMQPAGFFDVSDEDSTPDPDGADGIVDNSIPVALDAGEADDNNDFVEEKEASISGFVSEDVDNDDEGDEPIEGVQILLKDLGGNTIASTTTDASGFYQFSNVAPGSYIIMEMQPDRLVSVSDEDSTPDPDGADGIVNDAIPVELAGGENDSDNNFVEEGYVSVGSTVFEDSNNNGVQDIGESGIPGVTVQLFDANGNNVGTTTTDGSGFYFFGDLTPGVYMITIPTPDAVINTSSSGNGGDDGIDGDDNGIQSAAGGSTSSVMFTLLPNSESPNEPFPGGDQDNAEDFNGDMTIDFGFYAPGSIGDFVWFDINGDGRQDGGEPGLEGVTVNLLDGSGNLISSTTSGPNGGYLFTGLAPGDYIVEFITPAAYTQVVSDGTDPDDPGNSDYNPVTGRTSVISLGSGENELDIDAGFNLILEVNLLSFVAQYDEAREIVDLDWTTASENELSYFVVERAYENGAFEAIGRVDAIGQSTTESKYNLSDENVTRSGNYLYRLEMHNMDGSSEYSDVASIKIRKVGIDKPSIKVYPNPAQHDVNVEVTKNESEKIGVHIFDLTGKLMSVDNVNIANQGNSAMVNIPVSNLPKAAYILRVTVAEHVFTKKFTVID